MAATKYIVSTTDKHAKPLTVSRKEYAIKEAGMRARAVKFAVAVTVTTTSGKQVFATDVARPKAAAGNRGTRRPSQGMAAAEGWDLLYDKPAIQAQYIRHLETKTYALYCVTHGVIAEMENFMAERAARRTGDWCLECVAHGGPTTKTFGRKAAAAPAQELSKELSNA